MPSAVNTPRSLRRVVADSVLAYFYPLTKFIHQNMRIERIYYIRNGSREHTSKAYNFSGKVASYNQSAIIEYVFMLAECHKALRLSIEKDEGVNEKKSNLIREMNKGFFSAVSENFNLLHEHFTSRSKRSPIISIRGHWRTEDQDAIITLFRDRDIRGDTSFAIKQSTAISHCARTGEAYLCNDIPRALIDSIYLSPRFRSDEAKKGLSNHRFPFRRSYLERNWTSFWVSADTDHTVAFRSNLTVPIMIESRRLSSDTIKKFNAASSDKLIFGYLCLDHGDAGYFDDKLDIPIVKMISDILSIFSFQRLRFTDFSQTFKTADGDDCQSYEDMLKAFSQELTDILKSDRTKEVAEESSDRESDENIALVNADEMMLQLAEGKPFFVDS